MITAQLPAIPSNAVSASINRILRNRAADRAFQICTGARLHRDISALSVLKAGYPPLFLFQLDAGPGLFVSNGNFVALVRLIRVPPNVFL